MLNEIHNEDCLTTLKRMPECYIDCCITSPPYWGLRDYGVDGQLGLEKTPEEYVAKMVAVFREVRRVLKNEGTVWLNLGDTYSSHKDCKSVSDTLRVGGKSELANVIEKGKSHSRNSRMLKKHGYKNKDLIGIPWRVAFALQADGWWLRQDIIWHKPNPMPESVTDRCTKAHEYVFLLTKSARYYYDAEAIKEKASPDQVLRDRDTTKLNNTPGRTKMGGLVKNDYELRNRRSVWTIETHPYKEAHFAVFPEKLIEPCILAGCPKGGIVYDPFMGSGTVAKVALRSYRKFIGSELNAEYVKIANNRIRKYLTQHELFE